MACGTVPVAFASGGVPEQIVHGKNGILIPRGDTKAMINATLHFLSDHHNRLQMEHSATQRAKTHYSMERFIERHP